MLGVSGLFASSGDCAAEEAGGGAGSGNEGGNVGAGEVAAPASSSGGFSEDDNNNNNNNNKGRSEDGDRSFFSGNRWPRQETLALLKIRSDMDLSFRDATHKGPLWEDISRKLGEMGYQRSGKKCKEKFENVYKYHKRTKEGRASRPDAKTYRFFDQLEALDSQPPAAMCFGVLPPPPRPQNFPTAPPLHHINHITAPSQQPTNQPPPLNHATMITMASTSTLPSVNLSFPPQGLAQLPLHASFLAHRSSIPSSSRPVTSSPMAASDSSSSSSSTSSDKDIRGRRKRKRKWKDFFDRLLNEVLVKQEELQRKFLEAIEKREQERIVREEAWKMQEMARLNREHEILVQERTLAAAKDAAVIAFLQKMTAGGGQQQTTIPVHVSAGTSQVNQVPSQPHPEPTAAAETAIVLGKNEDNSGTAAPSRWPKTEVQALINLRTRLETKYQESGPKGPLWEEISAEMRSLGYNRSSKRCKEKWENINKYFKKVKESNRRRPEDSKTCPYFQQLDELYREKSKGEIVPSSSLTFSAADYIVGMKPPAENNAKSAVQLQPLPLPPPPSTVMIRPEQNWPILPAVVEQTVGDDEVGSENAEAAEPFDDDEEELDDDDEEEEEEENSYSILTSKHTQT